MIVDECDTLIIDGITHSVYDAQILRLEQIKQKMIGLIDDLVITLSGHITIDAESIKTFIVSNINGIMIILLEQKTLSKLKHDVVFYNPNPVLLLH